MTRLRIDVPATSANLGPGFDALGLALDVVNTVDVELVADDSSVQLESMSGDVSERIAPHDNLLCQGYRRWAEDSSVALPGARFTVENRIPMARGLGASAAAIVAGLAAAASAEALGKDTQNGGDGASSRGAPARLPRERIARLASLMEGHADNAVAATLGGMTVAFIGGDEVHSLSIANHLSIGVGLYIPDEPLLTAEARAILPERIPRADAVFNIGRAAYLATALMWGRWECIGPAMADRLHQPYRSRLLAALDDVIVAARAAGAYGAALSGGGPAVIALGPQDQAGTFAAAMEACAHDRGWAGRSMVTGVRHLGVQVNRADE